jgi:phage portal protein BeeE
VIVKSGATLPQLERFEKQIESKLRGKQAAGKFLTITGDVELLPLNFPPAEVGDAEQVVEEIAAVFGVPVAKLKANDPNRANAETADAGWMKDTIAPLIAQDEQKLNEAYLPLFGIEEDAFLAYDDPVPQNRRLEVARRTRLVAAGILTVNEARAREERGGGRGGRGGHGGGRGGGRGGRGGHGGRGGRGGGGRDRY